MIFRDPIKLDKVVLRCITFNNLVCIVGRPVADNHPPRRRDFLRDHGTNRVLDESSLVVRSRYEDVEIAKLSLDHHYLLATIMPVPLSHLMQDRLLPILKAASARL